MTTLIIFAGLPGTGKTTLCKLLKKKIKCHFFDSDKYAKKSKLFKPLKIVDPKQLKKAREKFYDIKVKETEKLLKKHDTVIMDAVFDRENLRKKFYKMAKSIKAKLIIVKVIASDKIIRNRILEDKSKTRPGAGPESRLQVYKIMKKNWQPIKRKFHTINSNRDPEDQLNKFIKKYRL